MRTGKSLLTLLCLSMFVFSCSKKNNYPKSFTRQEFISGEILMYTKTGKVADEAKISKFAHRIRNHFMNIPGSGEIYSFEDDINSFDDFDIELVFQTETSGEVILNSIIPADRKTIKFILRKQEDYYIASVQDTIISYSYSEDPRHKCKPEIIKREPVPPGGEKVYYLRPFYIRKDKNEVCLYIVSYMANSYFSDELTGIFISGAVNNMINEDYLAGLSKTAEGRVDTIVFKESYIVFR